MEEQWQKGVSGTGTFGRYFSGYGRELRVPHWYSLDQLNSSPTLEEVFGLEEGSGG